MNHALFLRLALLSALVLPLGAQGWRERAGGGERTLHHVPGNLP